MTKIIDRRNISMGGNDKRSISQIKSIAVHYSATTEGNTASFERYWKGTRKWNTGGYHEVILTNGDVELNYNADAISNGVYGHNTKVYNICYVGAGKPNNKQLATLRERINYNRNRLNISVANVKGHREFSGQSTQCPALDMDDFRKSLTNTSSTTNKSTSKPQSKPTNNKKSNQTTTSIVVYLQSIGQPFSFNYRKKLAREYGMKNYSGTSVQNLMLLDKLRNGSKSKGNATSKPKANLKVDGYMGKLTIIALQKYFGTPTDGVISKPSTVIKALQKLLKVKQDGYMGKVTITALQKRFNMKVIDGVISKPSLVVKELQRRLNKGKL